MLASLRLISAIAESIISETKSNFLSGDAALMRVHQLTGFIFRADVFAGSVTCRVSGKLSFSADTGFSILADDGDAIFFTEEIASLEINEAALTDGHSAIEAGVGVSFATLTFNSGLKMRLFRHATKTQ